MTADYLAGAEARETLAAAIQAALPADAVHPIPPAAIAGPTVVCGPGGWKPRNGTSVAYQVDVSCLMNGGSTADVVHDLEVHAATAWIATLRAGWACSEMSPLSDVTYAGTPYLGMTYTASRPLDLEG